MVIEWRDLAGNAAGSTRPAWPALGVCYDLGRSMRACVVVFPGSNADAEMVHTLRDVCGAPTTVAWHTDTALPARHRPRRDPGRLRYGDYLRTGAIAKVEPHRARRSARTPSAAATCSACATASRSSPRWACSPGALTRNVQPALRVRRLVREGRRARARSRRAPGDVWRLPIAHGEGRYQADRETLRAPRGRRPHRAPLLHAARRDRRARPTPTAASTRSPGIYGGPRRTSSA